MNVRTHNLGSMCQECGAVLVPDACSCGSHHGYGYQQANEWAARTWPDHPCFARVTPHAAEETDE